MTTEATECTRAKCLASIPRPTCETCWRALPIIRSGSASSSLTVEIPLITSCDLPECPAASRQAGRGILLCRCALLKGTFILRVHSRPPDSSIDGPTFSRPKPLWQASHTGRLTVWRRPCQRNTRGPAYFATSRGSPADGPPWHLSGSYSGNVRASAQCSATAKSVIVMSRTPRFLRHQACR
jgi:hypothetical protein